MESLTDCEYRHGFTGTLKSSESKTHRLVLEGCFGEVKRFVNTKELMDKGTVADFKVKAIVLSHSNETRKKFKDALKSLDGTKKWPAEREFIVNNEKRNNFIKNLVHSLEGQNNLILFDLVEKHGKVLEPLLRKEGRELHFIYGGTKGEERENIRHHVENDSEKRHDILASYGVFSTGVNLKRLDNVIFATGSKSEIKVLQSIGRTLRKADDSTEATLYDITDDLSVGSFENYTLKHFKKRIEIYGAEEFPYKIYTIEI
jgi:superfamily II DNA or RNA helicase